MDYINNNLVNLEISNSDILKSLTFKDYIEDPMNSFKGFSILFGTDSIDPQTGNLLQDFDSSILTEWRKVKTTKTLTGFELYITNEDLPLDYIDAGTVDVVGTNTAKYKVLFIGYVDLIDGLTYPIIALNLTDKSIIYDINTTIRFNLNPKCSYFLNDSEFGDLNYMDILESKLDYDESQVDSILTLKNKLVKDSQLNDISSADYINGVLKYKNE